MYVGQWRCYEGDKSNCVNLQFIQDARPKAAWVFYVWTQAHNCKYKRTYSVSSFFNLKKKEGGKKLLSSGILSSVNRSSLSCIFVSCEDTLTF